MSQSDKTSEQASGLNRREMLLSVGAAGASLALSGSAQRASAATEKPAKPHGNRPKNVIWMIADGMSLGTPTIAEDYSRTVLGKSTNLQQILADPSNTMGLLATRSLNSLVTDSAASASAWSSGRRINNAALNTLPDGRALTPLIPLLKQKGVNCGIVTTDSVCGASVAAFCVAEADRNSTNSIAKQYADLAGQELAPDVIMGGGLEHFKSKYVDLVSKLQSERYGYLTERSELKLVSQEAGKILGLFNEGSFPYSVDRINDKELSNRIPSLAEMVDLAIRVLSQDGKPFFLVLEAAHVDHAAHDNDAAAIIWDQLTFDETIGTVKKFVDARDDTLMVMTTDHANANPGMRGMGGAYADTNACFARLAGFKASHRRIRSELKERVKHESMHEATRSTVKSLTGIALKDKEVEAIANAMMNDKPTYDLNDQQYSNVGTVSQVFGNYTGIGWVGTGHTSDDVLIASRGVGAGAFAGIHPHKHLNDILCDFMQVSHNNPSME